VNKVNGFESRQEVCLLRGTYWSYKCNWSYSLNCNGSYRERPNVVLWNLFRNDVLYIAYNPSACFWNVPI